MKKTVIIVGTLALLGVGAFLFFGLKSVSSSAKKDGALPLSTDVIFEKPEKIEAQRILDWVTRSKPSIAVTTEKFQKIKDLGYKVVGLQLVPLF